MKVILLENVRKIGSIGEIIDVKRGFARNFLIANKKALFASKDNIKAVEKIKQDLNKKDNDKKKEAKSNIIRAREFLIGKQLNVGKYYLKRNNPTAAMRRFKKIRKTTEVSKFLPEVSYRLIESFLLVGLFSEALSEKMYMRKK